MVKERSEVERRRRRLPPPTGAVALIGALSLAAVALPAAPAVSAHVPTAEMTGTAGVTPVPRPAPALAQRIAPTDLSPLPAAVRQAARAGDKLDGPLGSLVNVLRASGIGAARVWATRRGLLRADGTVLVRVDTGLAVRDTRLEEASSRAIVDEVLVELGARGARVRNVWGPYIEAAVPLAEIEALLDYPIVRGVRRPWRAVTEATSEGRETIGAQRWEGVTFRTPAEPLEVGVIDSGFEGFRDLQGSDLPPATRITVRSFTDDDDIEGDSPHGAAVAEIIHDVVPDVGFVFANIETSGDLNSALTFFIEQGVDVINMSLGFFNAGPGNGTGPIVDIVDRAPDAGIPFVTSAGNQADRHWIGPFADADGDGFLDFAPGDETNSFMAAAGETIDIFMVWDFNDWTSSSQDLDLILIDDAGNVIDQSRARQAGFAGQFAAEEISIELPFSGTFHIVVERVAAPAPGPVELHTLFSGLEYVVPGQSLTVPADAPRILAIGAAHWSNDQVEFFSSRGPTKDGRIKPDMAAPDGVSTESFGPLGFFGTSAAAPHAVGAIALLGSRLGLVDPSQAIDILRARAIDLGPPGSDNLSGLGRLSLVPPG